MRYTIPWWSVVLPTAVRIYLSSCFALVRERRTGLGNHFYNLRSLLIYPSSLLTTVIAHPIASVGGALRQHSKEPQGASLRLEWLPAQLDLSPIDLETYCTKCLGLSSDRTTRSISRSLEERAIVEAKVTTVAQTKRIRLEEPTRRRVSTV